MITTKSFHRDKVVYPESMNRLYRLDEIPPEFQGRGVVRMYGKEELFSPFRGLFSPELTEFNWKCERCGHVSFWSWIVQNKYRCEGCGCISHKWRNGK